MKKTTQRLLSGGPLVVGTVHSPGSLRVAAKLKLGEVDVLEFRIDSLAGHLDAAERAMKETSLPVLLTVRHPAEGGTNALDAKRRKELYRRFLPYAALVDIELRSLPVFADIVAEAQRVECGIVVSTHDFKKTPPTSEFVARQKAAVAHGADIFKIACVTAKARDLARLLDFSQRPSARALSIMGMGRFGKASRLALAEAGSVLNYGYLHAPNAPGQWEARELRKLISAPQIVADKAP